MTDANSDAQVPNRATLTVELSTPVCRCAEEEAIFHSRLSELAGLQKIINRRHGLLLTVMTERPAVLRRELEEICKIWDVRISWPEQ